MRITPCQAALAAAIAFNLLLLLLLSPAASPPCRDVPKTVPKLVPGVTVILRDTRDPEHDLTATSRSFSSLPGVPVLVAAESVPYPPVALSPGVTLLSLQPRPHRPPPDLRLAVLTRHVALVPDGARAAPGLLRRMRDVLESATNRGDNIKVVAAAVGDKKPACLGLEVDLKRWTARYSHQNDRNDDRGDHRGDQNDRNNDRGDHQGHQNDRNNDRGDHQGHQNDRNNDRGDHQGDQSDQNNRNNDGRDHQGHQSDQSDHRGVRCGALDGAPPVLLLRTHDLFSLPFPLDVPVVTSLSFQASLRGWRFLLLLSESFPSSSRPPASPHSLWKSQTRREEQHRALMGRLGIKLELLADGRRQRWHGCAKTTPRCFGTVLSQTPQYLLEGRWTPPCCLRALRTTARHVLDQLESSGIRHWLEGGSLLGAVRHGDIIPWDYDVDVGLYLEDVPKCPWLARVAATGTPVEDPQGFLWEKAPEGDFYRVHFSRVNRLHVDLWPFYPDGKGMMTKKTWLGHGQDVEFPERFVAPPSGSVPFAGGAARAPNEPRRFLEFKFGRGAVERAEYPNPAVRRLEEDLGTEKPPW